MKTEHTLEIGEIDAMLEELGVDDDDRRIIVSTSIFATRIKELEAQIALKDEALEEAEWGDFNWDEWGELTMKCPVCDGHSDESHDKDCILKIALYGEA